MKKPLHFYQNLSQAPEVLHILNKLVSEADADIAVTAEYNRSLPPGLTNLFDLTIYHHKFDLTIYHHQGICYLKSQ